VLLMEGACHDSAAWIHYHRVARVEPRLEIGE
jgi:hypothetical protein